MKTRVFRLNLAAMDTLAASCDKQLAEGFRLASSFVLGEELVLVFQADHHDTSIASAMANLAKRVESQVELVKSGLKALAPSTS